MRLERSFPSHTYQYWLQSSIMQHHAMPAELEAEGSSLSQWLILILPLLIFSSAVMQNTPCVATTCDGIVGHSVTESST